MLSECNGTKVLDKKGAVTESRKVLESVFSRDYSGALVHQLLSLIAQMLEAAIVLKNRRKVNFLPVNHGSKRVQAGLGQEELPAHYGDRAE